MGVWGVGHVRCVCVLGGEWVCGCGACEGCGV